MSSSSLVIRDAVAGDIPACLNLDHSFTAEHVWQMNILQESAGWQVTLRTERLPRAISGEHAPDETRLQSALGPDHCFVVAANKSSPPIEIYGYLTMRTEPVHEFAIVQDVVVDQPYRRAGLGTRLLHIARQWAQERSLRQILIETQTRNYPAISLCQSAGFIFCGFNDRYFATGDIAVFFGQTLRK